MTERFIVLYAKANMNPPEKRMMNMLMYYFDNPYEELFEDRIVCVDGDITSKEHVDRLVRIQIPDIN